MPSARTVIFISSAWVRSLTLAFDPGQPLQVGVVHDHELQVLGLQDVELHPVGAGLVGRKQSRERVLHPALDEAPVRQHRRLVRCRQLGHRAVVDHRRHAEGEHHHRRGSEPELAPAGRRHRRSFGVGDLVYVVADASPAGGCNQSRISATSPCTTKIVRCGGDEEDADLPEANPTAAAAAERSGRT